MAFSGAQTSPGANTQYSAIRIKANGLMDNSFLSAGINANLIGNGDVSNTALSFIANLTSDAQVQFNNLYNGGVTFNAGAGATTDIDISSPGGNSNFDNITLSTGDIVFLIGVSSGGHQVNEAQAGCWEWNGNASPMTRPDNYDVWTAVVGSRVYINAGGLTYGSTAWINTNNTGGTLGVTDITYQQQQNSYIGGLGVTITGNIISIGQAVETDSDVSFATITATDFIQGASLEATANTNQLILGTTNTMTFTMASLSANRIFTLPDANSNSVVPTTVTNGSYISFINSSGVQTKAVVIDQVLSSFSAGAGIVANTDTIAQAVNKLAGILNPSQNIANITASGTLDTATYGTFICNTNSTTQTLPLAANFPKAGITIINGSGITLTTLATTSGETLLGAGTIVGVGSSAIIYSDGTILYNTN